MALEVEEPDLGTEGWTALIVKEPKFRRADGAWGMGMVATIKRPRLVFYSRLTLVLLKMPYFAWNQLLSSLQTHRELRWQLW